MTPTPENIVKFCEVRYGTEFARGEGEVNIVYLEGCNAADLTPNADLPDLWNDTSLIISFKDNVPYFAFKAEATSEPGLSATMSKRAAQTKGVARIAIGFHKEKWMMGFHKGNWEHHALVQAAPILCHRDANRDGKRTGDAQAWDVQGLNQHGTRQNLQSLRVGEWSYACLVRRRWDDHMEFMRLCAKDPRRGYLDDVFRFSTTVVDYSKFIAS